MYEEILAKLKKQREESSKVSDRSLETLAKTLELVITTNDLLEKMDMSEAIKSLDGNINHTVSEAVKEISKKTKVENPKSKKDDWASTQKKEEIDIEDESKKDNNEPPQWAKDLMGVVNTLVTEKSNINRMEKLKEVLGNSPDFYKNSVIKIFEGSQFKDEDAFNTFIESTKTNVESFQQAMKENGIKSFAPAHEDVNPPKHDGATPELSSALEKVKEMKEKENK